MNAISKIGVSLPSNLAQYAPGQTRALEDCYLACINGLRGGVLQSELGQSGRTKERERMVLALRKWRTFSELRDLVGTDPRLTFYLLRTLRKANRLETTGPRNGRLYRTAEAGSNGADA